VSVAKEHLRIPSLDGLRAISIGLVLLGHLVPTLHLPWPPGVLAAFDISGLGVRVFFVISGFLITQLLLDERARTGGISLMRFYFRRTMRIFPPYYAYLLVIVALRFFGAVDTAPAHIVHAATYTTNYATSSWNVGHAWSLSVEEQFYLIWPALMILLGPKRWMWGAATVLIASPLLRVLVPSNFHRLDLVADSLAVGCVLAGIRGQLLANETLTRRLRPGWLFIGALATVTLLDLVSTRPSVVPTWMFKLVFVSAQNVLIAFIVHWSIQHHESAIGRVLNSAPLTFIGVTSYSIYIWQQPFLNHLIQTPFTTFPLSLAAGFACAVASYYWIEKPSLALRKKLDGRFAGPKRSGLRTAATAPAQ
jgi:peptidoglycan/LPS O-acetylase OafA/YrhL